LKKRTKKHLPIAGSTKSADLACPLGAFSKSFLLLFFKTEVLPFTSVAIKTQTSPPHNVSKSRVSRNGDGG
jgi:hypothetical protein